ncbi:hypothetical protein CLOLEP_02003 [[Clostridium] leptum DSM 753]|uniref:Uncharacterized protein n=1 Tax=[Clostridium] leptum DSM 753 TaxID=428125 RepID=A7VTV9_9FIRM|nr:hypothetical protein CLOLEP_02003 [[Clostridium] leptum DSM 753]
MFLFLTLIIVIIKKFRRFSFPFFMGFTIPQLKLRWC